MSLGAETASTHRDGHWLGCIDVVAEDIRPVTRFTRTSRTRNDVTYRHWFRAVLSSKKKSTPVKHSVTRSPEDRGSLNTPGSVVLQLWLPTDSPVLMTAEIPPDPYPDESDITATKV